MSGKPPDPIIQASRAASVADAEFLSTVLTRISISDFIDDTPPLTFNKFKPLRLIALVDSFYDYTDGEILAKVDAVISVEDIRVIRESPHYPKMMSLMAEAARTVAGWKTIDAAVEGMEARVAQSMAAASVMGKTTKERLSAGAEISARRSPKKSRGSDSPTQNIFIAPEVLKSLQAHHKMVGSGLFDRDLLGDDVIDGSVVNSGDGSK